VSGYHKQRSAHLPGRCTNFFHRVGLIFYLDMIGMELLLLHLDLGEQLVCTLYVLLVVLRVLRTFSPSFVDLSTVFMIQLY